MGPKNFDTYIYLYKHLGEYVKETNSTIVGV